MSVIISKAISRTFRCGVKKSIYRKTDVRGNTHDAREREFAYQEFSTFLVLPNLSEGNRPRPETLLCDERVAAQYHCALRPLWYILRATCPGPALPPPTPPPLGRLRLGPAPLSRRTLGGLPPVLLRAVEVRGFFAGAGGGDPSELSWSYVGCFRLPFCIV